MLCSIHLCEKWERKCARIVTVTIGGKYKNLEALTVNHNNILCQHQSDPERTQELCCWFCRWWWRSSFEIITFWIERFCLASVIIDLYVWFFEHISWICVDTTSSWAYCQNFDKISEKVWLKTRFFLYGKDATLKFWLQWV